MRVSRPSFHRRFNPRLREEATRPTHMDRFTQRVSIHASARRRRPSRNPVFPARYSFNPRLREEATAGFRHVLALRNAFQSTPPRGGDSVPSITLLT